MILNKKFISFLLAMVIFSLVVTPVLAAGVDIDKIKANLTNSAKEGGLETEQVSTIPKIIGQLINAMFGILGVVFLGYAVLGGILWMIAGGNEEKVTRAVKFIVGGVEGLLVIFLSYTLVYVVLAGLKYATAP